MEAYASAPFPLAVREKAGGVDKVEVSLALLSDCEEEVVSADEFPSKSELEMLLIAEEMALDEEEFEVSIVESGLADT
jgi:hypothetical protein